MFDFERLEVYQLARNINRDVYIFLRKKPDIDPKIAEQWKQSSMDSLLLLSAGVGMMQDADKRTAFTKSRIAVYECTSIIQLLLDLGQLEEEQYNDFYARYEQVSKMLLGFYRSKV
jgi:four helix bundle protein